MPEQRVDRERVLDAALAIVREQGETALSARAVAQRAGCSVQPLYSLFGDMDGLVRALYEHARAWVAAYNREHEHDGKNPFESNGLSHLRLARTERNLFHFLYLSPHMEAIGFGEVYASVSLPEVQRCIEELGHLSPEDAHELLPQHDRVRARHGRHAGNGRELHRRRAARAHGHGIPRLRCAGTAVSAQAARPACIWENAEAEGARMAGRASMEQGVAKGDGATDRSAQVHPARGTKAGEARKKDRARRQFRQHARRMALLVSFLLFPITIFYFSPVLVIEGALSGAVVASTIVFAVQFLMAIVLRRAFCGWLCAAGGLQELEATAVGKPAKLGWRTRVKYVIWVPWLCTIVTCAWMAGGFTAVDPLAGIPGGISLNNPLGLGIYFGIVALFFVPNLFLGRRAMCHCICWMAPFMVLGGKLGRVLHAPQMRVAADADACVACGKCVEACPMSLDVPALAQGGCIVDAECIQCAACADACPKDVLHLRIGRA